MLHLYSLFVEEVMIYSALSFIWMIMKTFDEATIWRVLIAFPRLIAGDQGCFDVFLLH